MSFFKKDKNDTTKNYADADVQTQLARIIEQLGFLERKIDSLSQNRGPRPGGRPGFGRPGGFSGGHSSGGFRGNREGGFRGNREGVDAGNRGGTVRAEDGRAAYCRGNREIDLAADAEPVRLQCHRHGGTT
jgi:hypothetical protein